MIPIITLVLVSIPSYFLLKYSVEQNIFPIRNMRGNPKEKINYELIYRYPGNPVLLFCNGNIGTMKIAKEYTSKMCEHHSLNLCCFDYSGYGESPGSISCKQILKDGETVYNELLSKGIHQNDIIVCGDSIGSGVAAHLANIYKDTRCCILISPYINLPSIMFGLHLGKLLNYVSYFFINDPLATYKIIDKISAPVILIHGTKDYLISHEHSKYLANVREQYKLPTYAIYTDNGHYIPDICQLTNDIFVREGLTTNFT